MTEDSTKVSDPSHKCHGCPAFEYCENEQRKTYGKTKREEPKNALPFVALTPPKPQPIPPGGTIREILEHIRAVTMFNGMIMPIGVDHAYPPPEPYQPAEPIHQPILVSPNSTATTEKPRTQKQPTQPSSTKDTKMAAEITNPEQAAKLKDISIERFGSKLIVPEGVELPTAIRALELKIREEDQEVAINHTLPIEVAEGMVGFLRVLEREFGFVTNTGTQSFFGDQPPAYFGIETSPGTRESIPVGRLRMPGIEGWLTPTFGVQSNRVIFRVEGRVKGKDRHKVDKLLSMVEEECKRHSIYKGHAIMTEFRDIDDCRSLEDTFPTFARLDEVSPNDVVFSRDTQLQVDVSLFTPIRKTELARKRNIPLKRGILLEGPYGTGKSLTAAAAASLCKENGWTFIYLKDVTKLAKAYAFAAQYQPAVIFAEDIDQVLDDPEERDEEINDILNAVDGIESKGAEIITVLTTNHIEKISPAMLRPGRLDTVVSVRPPDAEAAIRLVKMYAGDGLDPHADLKPVGELLAGEIPAVVREVVERSKLTAILQERELLTAEDISITAKSMKNHMALLKTAQPDTRSDEEKAAQIIADSNVKAAQIRNSDHGSNGKAKSHTEHQATAS